MIASSPRKPEQLKLKWENLKKAARKRNTKIRMNNLKTGGGKPEYTPPDDALDKVAAILGPTCDGYSVQFGGDAVVDMVEDTVVDSVEEASVINVPSDTDIILPFDTESTPLVVPPAHPTSKKFFFSSAKSKGKLKREAVADDLKASIINRNRAITEYYDAKRKHEEIIGALKRKKMEMEILNLEKTLYPSKNTKNNDDH